MTSRIKLIIILLVIAVGALCAPTVSSYPRKSGKWRQDYRTLYYSDSVLTIKGDSIHTVMAAAPGNHIVSIVVNDEQKRVHERRVWLASILAIFILGGLGVLIYSTLKRRLIQQLRIDLDKKTGTIGQMQEELKSLDKKSDAISATLDTILKQNIETIRKLTDESQSLGRKENTDFYPDKLEELQGKIDSIRLTMDRLHNRVPIQEGLEKTLDAAKDGIMSKVRKAFGESLDESDYQILSGVFAGLTAKEIGFITGLAPGTVRTRKSRLKTRVMGLPKGQDRESILDYFSK